MSLYGCSRGSCAYRFGILNSLVPLFHFFSVMKQFVSFHLIPFPLSAIAQLLWLVVAMVSLVKDSLLIYLLVFVWCSKQYYIIFRRSTLIQTPQPFMELSSPKHFNCFYNWVCLLPLWLPWISLTLSNKAITAKPHIFTKKCLFAKKHLHATSSIAFQFSRDTWVVGNCWLKK